MELIVSTVAVPWIGSLIGFAFAVSVIAALIALSIYAGPYYSLPRLVFKGVGQAALRRI
jgi:hypothetical protein